MPEKTAGTEVYVAALCEQLINLNIAVVVIKPGVAQDKLNEYYYDGIRVVEYPESEVVDKDLQTGKRLPAGLEMFKNLLVTERPDVVHFHEISGSNGITIGHLRVARELNIPIFTTLHLVGYACQTGMLRYKNRDTCNGIVEVYKCSVCTLHKKGFGFGAAEILSSVGSWIQKMNVDISILPSKVSGALSYPVYTSSHLALLHEIFSLSEKVFVLSDWFKALLLANKLPNHKMILLPKAVPNSYNLQQNAQRQKEAGEALRFVYLGRISRIKGLHTILEAFKTIGTRGWSFNIYGQVSEEDYFKMCQTLVKELKGDVKWKGTIAPKDVVETLSQYDAMIFPTIIQEMVGLVVQESFAAGVPVIGSNAEGIREQVIDGVDGLLFESGNSGSLKNVLQKVILDRAILPRLAANIKEPMPFTDVTMHTLNTYQSVLRDKETIPIPY